MTMINLLRPSQVEDFKSEIARIDEIERAPAFVRSQVDFPVMARYKRDLEHKLATEAPQPLRQDEIDAAVKREEELRTAMREDGMPTQAEMRRNPPGAVDKLRRWEARNKNRVLEWKNWRKRLAVSGALPNTLPDATDASNIESFRPDHHSGEFNLDVAQIPGKQFSMPETPRSVVLTDAEIALIREVAPETADKLATMSAGGRQAVKDAVARVTEPTEPPLVEPLGMMETINSATVYALGYQKRKTLATKLGIKNYGRTDEAITAAILAEHSGEPLPQL